MSSKQDRAGVRTAQDLEQKYNLSSIVTIKKAVENTAKGLVSTNNELNNFIEVTTKNLEEIQNQVDGNLTTWFYSGVPTTSNPPASEWTTYEEKAKHVGDLYYDKDTGYAYRWFQEGDEFSWTKMSDSDVTEALAIANAALDTADSKRRVFVVQPTTPYDVGDIWFRNNEDLYRCATARESGAFDASDFVVATKYTDDTVANEAKAIAEDLKTTVETHYVTNTKLKTTTDSINTSVEKLALQVDEKNKVFTTKPTPPYYVGDVYVLNDKIYYCTTERKTGEYTESDWELSVDAGTLVSKTEFNQTADDIRGSVETLDNDYQTTKTTRKKATGNPTYISDSGGYPLEKDFVYGMSKQETREGYNILPITLESQTINGLTITKNDDNSITINGTSTDNFSLTYWEDANGITLNGDYVFYLFGKNGDINLQGNENGTTVAYLTYGDGLTTSKPRSYTSDTKLTNVYSYIQSGKTFNNHIVKVMITKGTEVKEYEQYGAMPSPEFPSEIINNRGIENLLPMTLTEKTELGIKSSAIGNTAKITGKANSAVYVNYFEGELTLKAGTYNFCFYGKKGGDLNFYYTVNGVNNLLANNASTSQYATVTFNEDTTISKVYSFIAGGATMDAELQLMITKGSEKRPFFDYGSNYLVQKIIENSVFDGIVEIGGYDQWNGKKVTQTHQLRNKNVIPVEPNTTYTFSLNSVAITEQPRYFFYDKNNNLLSTLVTAGTFTTPDNCYYVNWHSSELKTNYGNTLSNPKIEKSSTATEYKEIIITYDLQGNELCELQNTRNNVDFVSGVFSEKISKIVLDGTQTNVTISDVSNDTLLIAYYNFLNEEDKGLANDIALLTNQLKGVINWSVDTEGIYINGKSIVFRIKKSTIGTTKAEVLTYLTNNPLIIYYRRATPKTIQLEPTEIKLYEGINNIYTESNIDVEEVDITYLTDSVLNTQYATKSEVKIAEENITSSINSRIDDTALNLKQELNTSIQQTADSITSEVASTYATNDEVGSLRNEMSTRFTQTNNTFEMQFKTLNSEVSNIDQLVNTNQATLEKYVRFIDGAVELGNNESPISLKIENDMLAFYQNDTKIAYISNNKLYITDGFFTNSLRIDSFGFFKEDNGSLSFGKVG